MELQSPEISELAKAMSQAQGEFEGATKNNKNPHYKQNYADLESCWEACRKTLSKHGLSLIQSIFYVSDKSMLVTTLLHISGQWMRSYAPLILEKQSSQGIGSAITYMRRYTMSAMLGLIQEDDDGEKAENRNKNISKQKDPQQEEEIKKENPKTCITSRNFR